MGVRHYRGSTPCGGRALLASPSSSTIASFAGRILEEKGQLPRQSPSPPDEVASSSPSPMGESAPAGSDELGNVDGSEGELRTDTKLLASSAAIVAVVTGEAGDWHGWSAASGVPGCGQ